MRIKLIAIIIFMFLVTSSYAHPGRLDGKGGHKVWKDFTYKNGTVVKKGSYHYHALSDESRFGEIHLLEDDKEEAETVTDFPLTSDSRIGANYKNAYHKISCPYAEKIREKNTVFFKDRQDALKNNYKPCRRCSLEDIDE